jgi:hypothetical protein
MISALAWAAEQKQQIRRDAATPSNELFASVLSYSKSVPFCLAIHHKSLDVSLYLLFFSKSTQAIIGELGHLP